MSSLPSFSQSLTGQKAVRRSSRKLFLLIALCVTPVLASYLAYYVFPPSERTNYGTLIEPQRPVPAIAATPDHAPEVGHAPAADHAPEVGHAPEGVAAQGGPPAPLQTGGLAAFKGQWIMLAVDGGACALPCAEKLFFMRQTHVSLGKERGRLNRVLLVTDATPLPAGIRAAHPDLTVLRADQRDLTALLPVEATTALADHIYLIDPRHNLMMRFPKDPDPARTRQDLQKLLKASRIG